MNTETIIALALGVEQMIAAFYKIVLNAGLSPDETQAYIARIVAASAAVPDPKVGE
jgi:hypothetical protein